MNQSLNYFSINYTVPIAMILIGLMILIRKKPLIFNHRWFLLFIVLFFISVFIRGHYLNFYDYFLPTLMIVLLGYRLYTMREYSVLGADSDDFQKNIFEYLNQRNYVFELTSNSIKIKEPVLEIGVTSKSWLGNGRIKMVNKENKETFDDMINELKNKDIKPNLYIPFLYITIGAILFSLPWIL